MIFRKLIKISYIVFISFAITTSCRKDDPVSDYSYFVSKEFVVSYSEVYINNLIDIFSESISEIDIIKPLIASDVNIYKIVYNTTIDGEKIKASGLVCIPSKPGDYPVMSFQNGTNTVNAYAPSEFAINYPYQLVEVIASMGYIVVIADYPGFGESVQVTHPYLVAEPTVRSLVDILYAVKELAKSELPGITLKDEYYLLGYSQGGWATLALHKALELEYSDDFNLIGSACGAGPYDIFSLVQGMLNRDTYPMPVYIGYILQAYTAYDQFTNPVTDILNEPYAARLNTLYTGLLNSDQINNQLTTSISSLITPAFLTGFATDPKFSTVRNALNNNSISSWNSQKPLLLLHGGGDIQVSPLSTENIYAAMINSGTSQDICEKLIIPNLDHGDAIVPCMLQGILFLINLASTL